MGSDGARRYVERHCAGQSDRRGHHIARACRRAGLVRGFGLGEARSPSPIRSPGRASGQLCHHGGRLARRDHHALSEEVAIELRKPSGDPVAGATISASGDGVRVEGESRPTTNDQGKAVVRIGALDQAPELKLSVQAKSGENQDWVAPVPVVPGLLWIEPHAARQGTLVIRSPVQHPTAFVTVFSRRARVFGTRVDLTSDGANGAQAELKLPPLPEGELWAEVSPDPPGHDSEIIAWPPMRLPIAHASQPRSCNRSCSIPFHLPSSSQRKQVSSCARARWQCWGAPRSSKRCCCSFARVRCAGARCSVCEPARHGSRASAIVDGRHLFWLKLVAAALVIGLGFFGIAFVSWLSAY